MNHIEKYKDFGEDKHMNEKISWKTFLLALGIFYTVPKVMDYAKIRRFYTQINNNRSNLSDSDKKKIESIRAELVDNVKKSNIFKKFNKQFIIDSLSKVEIHVMDSSIFLNDKDGNPEAAGVYVNFSKYKNHYLSGLTDNEPNIDNIIIIKRDIFNTKEASSVIIHELYHYFDGLMGKGDTSYSTHSNISKFLDKSVSSKEGFLDKLNYLITRSDKFSHNDSIFVDRKIKKHNYPKDWKMSDSTKKALHGMYKDIENISTSLFSTYTYISSDAEFYTRWKTFKHVLLKNGMIKDINEEVTKNKILDFIDSKAFDEQDLKLLVLIDLDKLSEIEKVF